MTGRKFDAGHFSFLELIKILRTVAGAEFAKGTLIRTGLSAAQRMPDQEYVNWDAFMAAVNESTTSIAAFEGQAMHYGDGVFGLSACPFTESISTYKGVAGSLPPEYKEVTEKMNAPSRITETLRAGEGAAVSPFCCVHQPIRSEIGRRIKVGGRLLKVYQLGCKSAAGVKGLALRWCNEAGVSQTVVEKILDENMCCYCIRIE